MDKSKVFFSRLAEKVGMSVNTRMSLHLFPVMLWLSKFNMVHENFYRDRSTADLLKNNIDHRPLGSRISQLVKRHKGLGLFSFREMAHSVQPVKIEELC